MIKIKLLIAILFLTSIVIKAQNVMQISGPDCNGNNHDLYADLDAGKAVILHFFMPNCASCPPPAQKIQSMANHILSTHPGMITAYAMPYNNSTTCATTASWCTTSNLPLYTPYDSGATQVANYGGFGMPTVVLLGGANPHRRVMFASQSFNTTDTTIMRDSILNLFAFNTGIQQFQNNDVNIEVVPNPGSENIQIIVDLKSMELTTMELFDFTGKKVAIFENERQFGRIVKTVDTSTFPNGTYLLRLNSGAQSATKKITIQH